LPDGEVGSISTLRRSKNLVYSIRLFRTKLHLERGREVHYLRIFISFRPKTKGVARPGKKGSHELGYWGRSKLPSQEDGWKNRLRFVRGKGLGKDRGENQRKTVYLSK